MTLDSEVEFPRVDLKEEGDDSSNCSVLPSTSFETLFFRIAMLKRKADFTSIDRNRAPAAVAIIVDVVCEFEVFIWRPQPLLVLLLRLLRLLAAHFRTTREL